MFFLRSLIIFSALIPGLVLATETYGNPPPVVLEDGNYSFSPPMINGLPILFRNDIFTLTNTNSAIAAGFCRFMGFGAVASFEKANVGSGYSGDVSVIKINSDGLAVVSEHAKERAQLFRQIVCFPAK